MTPADREALAKAVKSLEHPSLAARLTNLIGKPVELIGYALPSFASNAIASATAPLFARPPSSCTRGASSSGWREENITGWPAFTQREPIVLPI